MTLHDPYMGAAERPAVSLDLEDQAVAARLAYCLSQPACRSVDRDLHALVKPDADPKTPVPRYTSSTDAILRLIAEVLPRWVHGHTFFPQVDEDRALQVRGWVAGPGYISDEYMGDCFEADAETVPAALVLALLKCLAANGRAVP